MGVGKEKLTSILRDRVLEVRAMLATFEFVKSCFVCRGHLVSHLI